MLASVGGFMFAMWKWSVKHIDTRIDKLQNEMRADMEILHKRFNNFVQKEVLDARIDAVMSMIERLIESQDKAQQSQERLHDRFDRLFETMSRTKSNG